MNPNDPIATSTTIEDDGPKWRVIALLVISGVLIIAATIAAILIIDALQLDRRAALAIAEAARIAEETRSARVFFWIVFWISAALTIMGGAAALIVIFGSLAYRSIDAANASRSLISGPQAHGQVQAPRPYYPHIYAERPSEAWDSRSIRTTPDLRPGLPRGPRQETLTSPQSSMISEIVQDKD